MDVFAERRKYQRCSKTICKVYLSRDGQRWSDVELSDISAGGLRFSSSSKFDINTELRFNLNVYNNLSEFNMKVDGRVINTNVTKNKSEYSVKFENINKYTQVQLDEIIKSKVCIGKDIIGTPDDGTYTFLLIPKKSLSIRNKMRMLR